MPNPPVRQPYTLPEGASEMPSPPSYPPRLLPTGVPAGVIRTRAELESLRDDALEMLANGDNRDFRILWLDSPHALRDGLRGILNSVRWLLGEIEMLPITDELPEHRRRQRRAGNDPDENGLPTRGQIFYERRDAEEAEDGFLRDIPRWYALGVRKTLGWATYESTENPRPIGPPLT